MITSGIFQAFLNCETKSYLKFSGVVESRSEYNDWQRRHIEDFKQRCVAKLRSNLREDECLSAASLPQQFDNCKYCLLLDCIVQAQDIQSRIHALERITLSSKAKHNPYIPIRLVPSEKITKHDKLLLAF